MSDSQEEKTELPNDLGKPILDADAYRFASLIATGACSSIPEAYKQVFPNRTSSKWVEVNAYNLAKSPKIREYIDTIQQAARLQIVLELPESVERLVDLARNAKTERTKLQANLELLDRGGMKAPQRIESLQIGIFGSLETEDMKNILRKNLSTIEKESDKDAI